ncbi:hypothetical protein OTK49_03825 [Vibrio coralliirubri]|uniref:hypothetical protein n=1 Tax=Vibrio coralliirubri TaxID=1516159 RepID=UPI002283A2BF|nr:hypothetical protein [Vibrio coralliirubri]MCY9861648.1 hypothetical protein [Vibrio coralliirubri]
MLSKKNQNYLNDINNRIKKRQGKINIITTHLIPEKYELVFPNGAPNRIISAKELQGKNTEGSIVHLNGSSYKVVKRLFISRTVLQLHLDNLLP